MVAVLLEGLDGTRVGVNWKLSNSLGDQLAGGDWESLVLALPLSGLHKPFQRLRNPKTNDIVHVRTRHPSVKDRVGNEDMVFSGTY